MSDTVVETCKLAHLLQHELLSSCRSVTFKCDSHSLYLHDDDDNTNKKKNSPKNTATLKDTPSFILALR